MELNFRNLRPNEIDVRIQQINKGGVQLLLYKDARCDQNILDETVGPMNWQRSHSRDNANCTVSIYDPDKNMWVSKEDTGTESNTEKEKGLASNSFKRACVNWSIGRELYTSPSIFFPKEDLSGYQYSDERKTCQDSFEVTDITYDGKTIVSVTIKAWYYDKPGAEKTFSNRKVATGRKSASNPAPSTNARTATVTSFEVSKAAPVSNALRQNAKTPTKGVILSEDEPLREDEEILMGNCRGMKYGDIKDKPIFISFLTWAEKNPKRMYDTVEANAQYKRILKLAAEVNQLKQKGA